MKCDGGGDGAHLSGRGTADHPNRNVRKSGSVWRMSRTKPPILPKCLRDCQPIRRSREVWG
jgi:hypothetical protein